MPMAEAIDFLKKKGVDLSTNWRKTAEIYDESFTVTNIMQMDILTDMKEMLTEALTNGVKEEDFVNTFLERLAEKDWIPIEQRSSRLQLVFEQNIRNSYAKGRWDAIVEAGYPYFITDSVLDKRTTENCRALDKKIFRTNDPYYNKYLRVPRHFRCRATETPLPFDELPEGMEVSEGSDFEPNPVGFRKKKFIPDLKKYDTNLVDEYKKKKKK